MRIQRLLAAMAVFAMAASAAVAAPLSAYGKLPSIERVSISPNGERLAIVVTNGEQRTIVVQDLKDGAITKRAPTGEAKVRHVQWAGDDRLVIVTSVTAAPMFLLNARREWMMAFALDLTTGKTRLLLNGVPNTMNVIVDYPVVREFRGEPTVFVQGLDFTNNQGHLSLYRVDLDTNITKAVALGQDDTLDWVIGPNGEPMAQEQYDRASGRWTLKLRDGPGWRTVETVMAPIDRPYTVGLGRDGKSVLYAMPDGRTGTQWREARLDGPVAAPLSVSDDETPIRDPQDGRLIGHRVLVGDTLRETFFDPEDTKAWAAVRKAYSGQSVGLESWSADRRKIVVRVDSPTEGPAYALVDLNTRKGTWIGAEYFGLQDGDVAVKQPLAFKAQDGLALTGYLTLPAGRPGKALPLIVFPHGGPASRDNPGFDWWAQGMASRGYAVAQVNFRGSDGLGGDLLRAGFGEWGRKMQTDLSDAVRHLAAQGVIDPKRVCIVGASYGGYAAMAGATIDHGVYRCAVSVAGVADLPRQVAYSKSRGGASVQRYWNRFMGADPNTYSPAKRAAEADIPILLIHGRDDTVVPSEQSRAMAAALEKAGKPFELVLQKGADHWLSRGDTRLQTLETTMAFVEKHNPPN